MLGVFGRSLIERGKACRMSYPRRSTLHASASSDDCDRRVILNLLFSIFRQRIGSLTKVGNKMRLQILMLAVVAVLVWKPTATLAQEQSQILCTSPSGTLRVENRAKEGADVWVVSTNDPTQQAKLPIETPQFIMSQCHFSPNEEWILVLWKNPMFLTGELFHRKSALEIERFDSGQSFNQIAWAEANRLGAVKRNYAAEGLNPQLSFGCWIPAGCW
jgi:hypothetical protein